MTSAIWDRDPFLLGTPDGTVNLRTGHLHKADPDDFITKLAAVAPSQTAECPLWFKFMREATNNTRA